ncbi:MAG: hypothetical protein R6V25_11395 [Desulfatiglandales bacterium]
MVFFANLGVNLRGCLCGKRFWMGTRLGGRAEFTLQLRHSTFEQTKRP